MSCGNIAYRFKIECSNYGALTYQAADTSTTPATPAKILTAARSSAADVFTLADFQSVSGLESSVDFVEFRTGDSLDPCVIPTFSNPGDITFTRGVDYVLDASGSYVGNLGAVASSDITSKLNTNVRLWASQCLGTPGVQVDSVSDIIAGENIMAEDPARDLVVTVFKRDGISTLAQYKIYNAVIQSFSFGSMSADNAEPLIEEIVVSNSGFRRIV